MPDSALNNVFHEETHDPLYADRRNFYKVEKWNRDWMRVELMLYAGDDLDKENRQGAATHPTDHTPTDAGAGRVGRHQGTVEWNEPGMTLQTPSPSLQRGDCAPVPAHWGPANSGDECAPPR
jgi:hypothetical protein